MSSGWGVDEVHPCEELLCSAGMLMLLPVPPPSSSSRTKANTLMLKPSMSSLVRPGPCKNTYALALLCLLKSIGSAPLRRMPGQHTSNVKEQQATQAKGREP